ncbi:MAG TPA: Bcr/CflA family efflux MFS transporter [Aliiroseovarius sp.]|nr:Bcr/CflA family efflux MFS transporter [Aliiroseovarius sp.]
MSDYPVPKFLKPDSPPHIATLIILAGIGALSMNIFLPSLKVMSQYFNTDYRLMQLSVALYLGMNAVLQIFIGPISDRFGRRPVMLWAVGLFILATFGCLMAPNVVVFLAFRMMQAVIIAGLVLSRAAVRDMVPTDQAASMIGYVTMGMSLVPMVGPVIGGALGQAFGWQANFWLLFILGGVVFALTWMDMGETFTRTEGGFRAQVREYPELLTSHRFWGYCLSAAFAAGAFFSYLGGAPFVGSEVYGMSDARLGLYFGAPALGYLVGNFLSGRFSTRLGVNRMILIGAVVPFFGLAFSVALFKAGHGSAEVFFGFMTIVGLGNGLVMPNANAGMLGVRPRLAGSAAGLGGAILIGGGAALSGFAGTLLSKDTGAIPLLWLMFLTSGLSILSILWVIRRDRQLA